MGCAWGKTSPIGQYLYVLVLRPCWKVESLEEISTNQWMNIVAAHQDGGFAPLDLAVRTTALPQCTKEG